MVLIQWCIWIHFQEGTIQNKIIKGKKKDEIKLKRLHFPVLYEETYVFPIEESYDFLNLLLYITTAKGNNAVIIKGMLQGTMG